MGVELGRLVQERRHELGLSRRDLADRSEVSYPYVSQIETGDRDPSLRTIRKLADVLEVPVEEMAGLVVPELWAAETPSVPPTPRARSRSGPRSYDDSVELYRDKVLPSVDRRLQSVPPLIRIQLLNELIARAVDELQRADPRRT
jgi:transcriptional regulator with XRE-family HTH domain